MLMIFEKYEIINKCKTSLKKLKCCSCISDMCILSICIRFQKWILKHLAYYIEILHTLLAFPHMCRNFLTEIISFQKWSIQCP